jgi:hypothetical protein
MATSKPEIHAVIEVEIPSFASWALLPPEPWPNFVRLCGATPSSEVALMLAVASLYGRSVETGEGWAQSLLDHFPRILPGGLAVVSAERLVMPSCCCGLEMWPEWRNVITNGQSPWTGHDPAPLVEVTGAEIHVWSDGGMGTKPIDESPIVFTREEFARALQQAADDLCDFLKPLRRWLDAYTPAHADALVAKFEGAFVHQ